MVRWKVFVNEVQEFVGYVRFHIHTEWRVEPNYISPSAPGGWWASSGARFEFDFFSVPAIFSVNIYYKTSFATSCCFVSYQ